MSAVCELDKQKEQDEFQKKIEEEEKKKAKAEEKKLQDAL
jgi:hypothetical protein